MKSLDHLVSGTEDMVHAHRNSMRDGSLWAKRRGWVPTDVGKVYVRVGIIYVGLTQVPSIAVANIVIHDRYQGRGIFKAYLTRIEEIADRHAMFVTIENVLNEHLQAHLSHRLGYRRLHPEIPEVSFYRAPVRQHNGR